ncbi:MAG: M48 family metallopeptidase [Candidatus Uhrbacteria bacterium]|nr:M48 family metallopeptidase [Candidatus Uhrbacteria bacterium]
MRKTIVPHKQREEARTFVHSRLEVFNEHYRFEYHRVAIRNQRTRWGSCSKKGNLNFNYRIARLPIHLADYVIVHELCHLGEFNHSPQFWNLVARAIPDHRERRKELRGILLASFLVY